MRNTIFTLALLFTCISIFAQQTPNKMSYQSVIRNSSNELVTNQTVTVRVSILQGTSSGTAVMVETHSKSTNTNGLVTLEIGTGSAVSGSFAGINWSNGPYFIKTETDPAGGSNYSITGTSELLSVPYAKLAESANSINNLEISLDEISDVNAPTPSTGQVLGWNGTSWIPQSAGGGSSYTAGTGLSLTGTAFNAQTTNPLWNANQLQGNAISATAPTSGQILTWDGSAWLPQTLAAGSSNWTLSGSNINRATGNVGIKTATPLYPLHLTWDGQSGPSNVTRGIVVEATARNSVNLENNNGIYSTINTNNTNGIGIYGTATGSNLGVGVMGEATVSANSRGVMGFARSRTGDATEKVGVLGVATGTTGQGIGSGNHIGVLGQSTGIGVTNAGLYGIGGSGPGTNNYGVFGTTTGSGTSNYGLIGIAAATGGGGNVGVFGTNSTTSGAANYAGYFNGNLFATGTITTPSDEKLKTNIQNLNSGLNLINSLRPVTYDHKPELVESLNLSSVPQMGFIAQELESVLPNLVKKELAISKHDVIIDGNENPDQFEFKSVNYLGLIPVLTKAIQEQQVLIQALMERIEVLEKNKNIETAK